MKTAFTFLTLIIILASCPKKVGDAPDSSQSIPEKLSLATVSDLGVFDPSLTFDTSQNLLWMSYSAVSTTSQLEPTQRVVSTRLASSNDGGLTWIDQGLTLAGVQNATISFSGLPTQGAWQNEVSKILYDPYSVNANDRWKLLTHHYLQVKSTDTSADRRFEHGWIAYKSASSPQLLASATEVKLFAAAAYNTANNTQGGSTGSPVAGAPLINLHSLHPDLNNCLVFSEPGFYSNPTALYMSLVCVEASNYRIVLLSCSQPCSVNTGWNYVKTILQNSNATPQGYLNFSASDLFEFQNKHYLMVTPEGKTGSPGIYHGCYVYKFSNIASGTLTTSTPTQTISGTAQSFNGACAYSEEAIQGFYYSEVNTSEADVFRIFKSNLNPNN